MLSAPRSGAVPAIARLDYSSVDENKKDKTSVKGVKGKEQASYTFSAKALGVPPLPYQHKKLNIPQWSTTSALGNGSLNALHSSSLSSVLETSSAECVSLKTSTLVRTQSLTPPFMPDVASHDASIVGVRLRLDIEDQVLVRDGGRKVVLPFCAAVGEE